MSIITDIHDGLAVTLAEAARLGYGAHPTLRSRIDQGLLPAYRNGNRVIVYISDLENMFQPELTDAVGRIIEEINALDLSKQDVARLRRVLDVQKTTD